MLFSQNYEKVHRIITGSLKRENVWFLILANEVVTDQAANEQADYYSQMAYLNYYNSMLGGYGYGGYGGYGYGNGYDNYYSYYMMQQMYNSMYSSSTKTTSVLDKDRYYRCVLSGPASTGRKPRLVLTYSYTNPNPNDN